MSTPEEIPSQGPKFPTLDSLAGAAGTLKGAEPPDLMKAAYEERLGRK